jgi:hypothetical protein
MKEKTKKIKNDENDENNLINELDNELTELQWFTERTPKWGGKMYDENDKITNIKIINTCTIDYLVFGIWVSFKLSKNINKYFHNSHLKQNILRVIDHIENNDWDRAKTIWLIEICTIKPGLNKNNELVLNAEGNEYQFFTEHLSDLFKYKNTSVCSNKNCVKHEQTTKIFKDLSFKKENRQVLFSFLSKNDKCGHCNTGELTIKKEFLNLPPFLIIECCFGSKISVDELPDSLIIGQVEYKFLSCTFFKPANKHYVSIFYLDNLLYLIDDLNRTNINGNIPKHNFSNCFYYLS